MVNETISAKRQFKNLVNSGNYLHVTIKLIVWDSGGERGVRFQVLAEFQHFANIFFKNYLNYKNITEDLEKDFELELLDFMKYLGGFVVVK